jgi:hypothetical protein
MLCYVLFKYGAIFSDLLLLYSFTFIDILLFSYILLCVAQFSCILLMQLLLFFIILNVLFYMLCFLHDILMF